MDNENNEVLQEFYHNKYEIRSLFFYSYISVLTNLDRMEQTFFTKKGIENYVETGQKHKTTNTEDKQIISKSLALEIRKSLELLYTLIKYQEVIDRQLRSNKLEIFLKKISGEKRN